MRSTSWAKTAFGENLAFFTLNIIVKIHGVVSMRTPLWFTTLVFQLLDAVARNSLSSLAQSSLHLLSLPKPQSQVPLKPYKDQTHHNTERERCWELLGGGSLLSHGGPPTPPHRRPSSLGTRSTVPIRSPTIALNPCPMRFLSAPFCWIKSEVTAFSFSLFGWKIVVFLIWCSD